MQGTQGIGMMGTLGSGSQMRPSGMAQHQQRPVQSSLRPASSPSSQAPVPQVGVFNCSCDLYKIMHVYRVIRKSSFVTDCGEENLPCVLRMIITSLAKNV